MPVDAASGAATGKAGDTSLVPSFLIQTLYPSHCEADRQGKATITVRSVTLAVSIIGGRVQSGGRVRERD